MKMIIMSVLLICVILFIILLIVFYAKRGNNNKNVNKDQDARWPPVSYMQQIGVKCPDYWEDMGPDPNNANNHICQNTLNVPVNSDNKAQCYDNQELLQKSFRTIDWNSQFNKKNKKLSGDGIKGMCDFTLNCGPTKNQEASWLGINTSNGYNNCSLMQ